MKIELLDHLSKSELESIKKMAGSAFVTNELFHEFGTVEERRELVSKYIGIYIDYAYKVRAIYTTSDKKGLVAIQHSENSPKGPLYRMIFRIARIIPYRIVKKFLSHIKQIANTNKEYASKPHMEILFLCVDVKSQGKGYARQLVEFAKAKADEAKVPLLFDTDMKEYAEMYQHFGCELYNSTTATNGVTRYNLVWKNGTK